jgi:exosortase N
VIAGVLLLTTILNILANLLRIVCLVLLLILPGNPLHGIFGLLLLGVYVLLPLLPMIRFAIHRYGHPVRPADGSPAVRSRWVLAGNGIVAAAMILLTVLTVLRKEPVQKRFAADTVPGYTLQNLPNAILQLNNSRCMVYIKPIPGFYYTDHTPSICWEGSGYTFKTLQEKITNGISVFQGRLGKGPETLYTAWWYDNGITQTTDPFRWRWDLIHGAAPYAVVNVTTVSETQLKREIDRICKEHPFRPLLGQTVSTRVVKIW